MIKSETFENKIRLLEREFKDLFLKEIAKKELKLIHKVLKKCFKKLDIIIKGSRALNNYMKYSIYEEEELLYVDYDMYSYNYKEDLTYITSELEKAGLTNIKCSVLPFKSDISRLTFYGNPIIDIEEINKKCFNIFKHKKINGIKYISPDFYKIDLYSILSQPTKINMIVYEKAYKRLDLVENNYKYKYKLNSVNKELLNIKNKNYSIDNDIKYILSILNENTIIIGNYVYNKLFKKNINIDYLELLTDDFYYYINKLKKKYKNRLYYKKFDQVMYIMSNYFIIYLDNEPFLILWNLKNNTSYTIKNGEKICSRYYLKFYYNFLSFFNYLNKDVFFDKNYYNYLLDNVKIKSLPNKKSIGNVNYDAIEQYINIRTGKRKDFFYYISKKK